HLHQGDAVGRAVRAHAATARRRVASAPPGRVQVPMASVLFFIAGMGAIGVVVVRNPFYAVLALVWHLLNLAALFLLLRAEFVAAAQVVVYAGAVVVLYVFVVAYVGGQDEPLGPRAGR